MKTPLEQLRKQLAQQQGESLLRAYPRFPVDADGRPIANKTTAERGVKIIAGAGNQKSTPIREVARLVKQHGGEPADWQKLTSESAANVEVHGYRNAKTGQIVEPKTKESKQEAAQTNMSVPAEQKSVLNEKKSITFTPTKMNNKAKEERATKFAENKKDILDKKAESLRNEREERSKERGERTAKLAESNTKKAEQAGKERPERNDEFDKNKKDITEKPAPNKPEKPGKPTEPKPKGPRFG